MSFRLGINYPWIACGHDLGPRPPAWAGAGPTDFAALERELRALRALGLEAVRFWILAGGVNLPVGAHAGTTLRREAYPDRRPLWRRVTSRAAPKERWRWDAPLALPRAFLDDFEALLGACASAGVTLVPSLVSFEIFLPIRDLSGGVSSRGHAELVLSPGFFDAALEPLLELSERHRSTIEAWEIANEPGWAVRGATRVDPLRMADFLVEGARRVARRGFRATIGFVDAQVPWLAPSARTTLLRLARAGRYVHQLHHYPKAASPAVLPPASESPIRPIWVGEMATSTARRWGDPEALEDDPDRFLAARLEIVRARGYDGAFLWSRTATDAQSRWDDRVRAQLR